MPNYNINKIKVLFSYDLRKLFLKPQMFLFLAIVFSVLSYNFFNIFFSYEQNLYKYNLGKIGANMIPVINSHLFVALLLYILILPFAGSIIVSNEKSQGFFDYLSISHIKKINILIAKNLSYLSLAIVYFSITSLYSLILMLLVKVNPIEVLVSSFGFFIFLTLVNSINYLSNLLLKHKISSIFLFYAIISAFYYFEASVYSVNHYPTEVMLKDLSVFGAFFNFQLGIMNLSSVLLLLGVTGLFIYMSFLVMNIKRYKVSYD